MAVPSPPGKWGSQVRLTWIERGQGNPMIPCNHPEAVRIVDCKLLDPSPGPFVSRRDRSNKKILGYATCTRGRESLERAVVLFLVRVGKICSKIYQLLNFFRLMKTASGIYTNRYIGRTNVEHHFLSKLTPRIICLKYATDYLVEFQEQERLWLFTFHALFDGPKFSCPVKEGVFHEVGRYRTAPKSCAAVGRYRQLLHESLGLLMT